MEKITSFSKLYKTRFSEIVKGSLKLENCRKQKLPAVDHLIEAETFRTTECIIRGLLSKILFFQGFWVVIINIQ